MLFIVLETTQEESRLLSLELFSTRNEAEKHYQACAAENVATEYPHEDLNLEISGTLRIAGDGNYFVQLIAKDFASEEGKTLGQMAMAVLQYDDAEAWEIAKNLKVTFPNGEPYAAVS